MLYDAAMVDADESGNGESWRNREDLPLEAGAMIKSMASDHALEDPAR